jgi:hypothetical protein
MADQRKSTPQDEQRDPKVNEEQVRGGFDESEEFEDDEEDLDEEEDDEESTTF